MSDTPQKTNPHNIVATVEETQKMTLNTSKTKHFANTICVLVTGIVLKFLKVSLSLSIKNKSAAIIPNIHGSSTLDHNHRYVYWFPFTWSQCDNFSSLTFPAGYEIWIFL